VIDFRAFCWLVESVAKRRFERRLSRPLWLMWSTRRWSGGLATWRCIQITRGLRNGPRETVQKGVECAVRAIEPPFESAECVVIGGVNDGEPEFFDVDEAGGMAEAEAVIDKNNPKAQTREAIRNVDLNSCHFISSFFLPLRHKGTKFFQPQISQITRIFHHEGTKNHEGFGKRCVLNAAFAPNTICAQGPRFVRRANFVTPRQFCRNWPK